MFPFAYTFTCFLSVCFFFVLVFYNNLQKGYSSRNQDERTMKEEQEDVVHGKLKDISKYILYKLTLRIREKKKKRKLENKIVILLKALLDGQKVQQVKETTNRTKS